MSECGVRGQMVYVLDREKMTAKLANAACGYPKHSRGRAVSLLVKAVNRKVNHRACVLKILRYDATY